MKLQEATHRWLDDRLDLAGLANLGREKTVPHHRYSIFYYLGGATLFLFIVQVVTGILLALYYRPSAAEAHASIQHLITRVPFGDLVRSIHAWSADLLIAFLFAHLFSVWIMRAYRRPRELTWVFGCFLLVVSITLGFTGYLLPWNELSYSATRVGTEIAGDVPFIGDGLRKFLRGGEEVSGLTLTRFYGFHIALLPGAAAVLLVIHLLLVQRQGISVPEGVKEGAEVRQLRFFPNALIRDLIYWLLLLAIIVSLATFWPREAGLEADPFKPASADIRPEWYFLFAFSALKLIPASVLGFEGEKLGVAAFAAIFLALFALPFVDQKKSPIMARAGWLGLLLFVGFTVHGWLA